jgi:hypothetical protein
LRPFDAHHFRPHPQLQRRLPLHPGSCSSLPNSQGIMKFRLVEVGERLTSSDFLGPVQNVTIVLVQFPSLHSDLRHLHRLRRAASCTHCTPHSTLRRVCLLGDRSRLFTKLGQSSWNIVVQATSPTSLSRKGDSQFKAIVIQIVLQLGVPRFVPRAPGTFGPCATHAHATS